MEQEVMQNLVGDRGDANSPLVRELESYWKECESDVARQFLSQRWWMQETMQDFIAKKREIFLVQMSLDTRRAEIRKLQDRIFQREEVRSPRVGSKT